MRHRLSVTVADQAADRYPRLPFEIPPGTDSFEVRLAYDRSAGVVDLGCEGPHDAYAEPWRGWSGGARESFVIERERATPGYVPGVEPGTWHVVLGLHQVAPSQGPYEPVLRKPPPLEIAVDIEVPARARLPDEPVAPVRRGPRGSSLHPPAPAGLTWFAGDLHAHTTHSDGGLSFDRLAGLGVERGLDFLAVTDHNTTSHHAFLPGVGARHDICLLPGQEVTTHRGHANAYGDLGFVDFRRPAAEWVAQVAARGGLLSVNHPLADDCAWQHGLPLPPALELWHISWFRDERATAVWTLLPAWDRAVRETYGRPTVLLGGSDFHRPEDGTPLGAPVTWVAAADRSPEALLEAMAAGRTTLTRTIDPGGPMLLRLDGELWVLSGEGCVLVDLPGRRRPVHDERLRLPEPDDVVWLESPDRRPLAIC